MKLEGLQTKDKATHPLSKWFHFSIQMETQYKTFSGVVAACSPDIKYVLVMPSNPVKSPEHCESVQLKKQVHCFASHDRIVDVAAGSSSK